MKICTILSIDIFIIIRIMYEQILTNIWNEILILLVLMGLFKGFEKFNLLFINVFIRIINVLILTNIWNEILILRVLIGS